MKHHEDRYYHILREVALASATTPVESHLADAFELGRALVEQGVPPDEVIQIHHEALARLSLAQPDLRFAEVAERLTLPLMETSMAYGLAFREQLERRYQAMVNTRLEQSNKLEALGTMAAGIAHEFNNILGGIIGFSEMAADRLAAGSLEDRCVRQVLQACIQARSLFDKLLSFARHEPGQAPVAVDVLAEIHGALALLRVSYPPALQITFQTSLDQARVLAEPGQIQQIVMNLCINAADAMAHRGEIFVHLSSAVLENGMAHQNGIALAVLDNGHGMSPKVKARMFDPFFTTKVRKNGSGLGLSVVFSIVNQLGGVIKVRSQISGKQRGTEITLVLPYCAGE